jgi:hypothetical protein
MPPRHGALRSPLNVWDFIRNISVVGWRTHCRALGDQADIIAAPNSSTRTPGRRAARQKEITLVWSKIGRRCRARPLITSYFSDFYCIA